MTDKIVASTVENPIEVTFPGCEFIAFVADSKQSPSGEHTSSSSGLGGDLLAELIRITYTRASM